MKAVLKLDVHDGKCKQKAMKMVSNIPGLESISVDMKEKKMTLTGDIDPVLAVTKLRRVYQVDMISVEPAKEPKKKEEPKNKAQVSQVNDPVKAIQVYPQYLYPMHYYVAEENPNYCVIC